jgi:hypothetical protein
MAGIMDHQRERLARRGVQAYELDHVVNGPKGVGSQAYDSPKLVNQNRAIGLVFAKGLAGIVLIESPGRV